MQVKITITKARVTFTNDLAVHYTVESVAKLPKKRRWHKTKSVFGGSGEVWFMANELTNQSADQVLKQAQEKINAEVKQSAKKFYGIDIVSKCVDDINKFNKLNKTWTIDV